MQSVEVIDAADAAIVAIDPVRSSLLARLAARTGSATELARELGLPRQRINYHLRALEAHGLVELVEERPRRGVMERILRASAESYLVSPATLGAAAAVPERTPSRDRLSARYLVAVAARAVREVGTLMAGAARAGKTLPTFTIDADIRFRSAAERSAFADDLSSAVLALAARYHDESAEPGRWHRLIVLAHPRPEPATEPRQVEPVETRPDNPTTLVEDS